MKLLACILEALTSNPDQDPGYYERKFRYFRRFLQTLSGM
jgi:hypothetical protein